MPRKVCIAVDPSTTSQKALKWAAQSVIRPGDKVQLFTVLHPSPESEMASGAGAVAGGARIVVNAAKAAADPAEAAKARALLDECKSTVVAEGVKADAVETSALVAAASGSADTGRELTGAAAECGCETLILGSRGMGISKKALLATLGIGSVSDYVLNHAPCNVVLFKDRAAA